MNYRLINSDVLDGLRSLPDESVQCVVTSPPYWGLRDYGVAGQLGLERTPDEYVAAMVAVFAEVRRVLRSNGTLWLNIGDSYWGGKGENGSSKARATAADRGYVQSGGTVQMSKRPQDGRHDTIKPKDLCMIPARLAMGLQADGWYLRSDIIWSKPNPMPESVTDRPTKAHEYLFLLTKSAKYFYDHEAIKEPGSIESAERRERADLREKEGWAEAYHGNPPTGLARRTDKQRGHSRRHAGFNDRWDGMTKEEQSALGRNKRSVWTIATEPFPEAHFATFPTALVEPCILAGTKAGDTVLDPFNGSGTTGVVALGHQRNYIGIELNPEYVAMARRRLSQVAPMFAKEIA